MRYVSVGTALRAFARLAVVPLLGLALGLGAAYLVSASITPTYRATGSMVVLPDPKGSTASNGWADVTVALSLTPSVARLAESRDVATAVSATLGLPEDQVRGHVTATVEPSSQVVTVRAEAAEPGRAAPIADAVITASTRLASSLGLGGQSGVVVRALDTAIDPTAPVSPQPLLTYGIGGLAGLLLGLVLVVFRAVADDRFRRVGEVESELGLPTLGRLRSLPWFRRGVARTYDRRQVRTALNATVAGLSVLGGGAVRRVLITSAGRDESIPLVAALLTHGMALNGRRAVLVDVQRRRRGVDHFIADRFASEVDAVLDPAQDDAGARMITTAALTEHLGGLDPAAAGALLGPMAERTDIVVVAGPAVTAGAGLAVLAKHVDAVLMVVDADRVSRAEATRAGLLVAALDVPVAGVLLAGRAVERDGAEAGVWQPASPPAARSATDDELEPVGDDLQREEQATESMLEVVAAHARLTEAAYAIANGHGQPTTNGAAHHEADGTASGETNGTAPGETNGATKAVALTLHGPTFAGSGNHDAARAMIAKHCTIDLRTSYDEETDAARPRRVRIGV